MFRHGVDCFRLSVANREELKREKRGDKPLVVVLVLRKVLGRG
jgi:hypothetical protein